MCAGKMVISLFAVLLLSCVAAQPASISEEGNMCVSVNETREVGYTCSSQNYSILWMVGSRQISGTIDGVRVNTTDLPGGGSFSSLVFTPEFLASMADGPELQVACLVQRNLFEVVEADRRTVVIFTAPPPPEGLRVVPTAMPLIFQVAWRKPVRVQPCPDVVYQITVRNLVTNMSEPAGTPSESYTFEERESDPCQLHQFEVVTQIGDSSSQPATERETLPLSPNVDSIGVTATPVLGEEIQIELIFDPATTCNEDDYPILNYTINIPELPSFSKTVFPTGQRLALNLSSSDFMPANYSVVVSACVSFGCRSAQPVTVLTSDVQSANITFLNTTVSLVCVFAATGSARGCRFSLELATGQTETLDISRPVGGGVAQQCATTQNNREAYRSVVVETIDSEGRAGDLQLEPLVNETADLEDISPCEPPTPEVVTDIVEKSTLSAGEIAAIIIVVVVVFALLVIGLIGIVCWKRQSIATAYRNWMHPLTEEEGIDLMVEGVEVEKPTIMMLMRNLVPGKGSSTTTVSAVARQKSLNREVSQQPDMAVGLVSSKANEAAEMQPLKTSDGAEPSLPVSGKEPVAAIKMKDPGEPNNLHLVLKPATLAKVVSIWRSKVNRGEEMLLYWKEDEEDVDDDEPYYNESDEEDS